MSEDLFFLCHFSMTRRATSNDQRYRGGLMQNSVRECRFFGVSDELLQERAFTEDETARFVDPIRS
jgi:hypothetical protein